MIRDEPETGPWVPVLMEACRDWVKASVGYLVRLGPLMVVAAFVSGLVIQWLSPGAVSTYLGNNIAGIAIAATFGILINVPLLFEIPLVALLLLFGMGTAPAATLTVHGRGGWTLYFLGISEGDAQESDSHLRSSDLDTGGAGRTGGAGHRGLHLGERRQPES